MTTIRQPPTGEPGTLEHQLVACLPVLRNLALRLCGSPSDADDLLQDTLERALLRADLFDGANDDVTPIPIGRYTGQAVVLNADLHIDSEAPGVLDDQRRWVNGADRRDFQHTQ